MEEHGEHRQLVRAAAALLRLGPGLALAALAAAGPVAAQTCRLALSLGIDVSSSVDTREYALQNEGLARALTAPEVVAAFLAVPQIPVALHVFEWSGRAQQALRLDWVMITSEADLQAVAARLRSVPRTSNSYPTALGYALAYGGRALAERRDCAQHTLDVSGDGVNNDGPVPEAIRADPQFDGVTVNGLVIGPTFATLRPYFERFVIQGPGAFVEVAEEYADFETTMRRKLLRELGVMVIGQYGGPAPDVSAHAAAHTGRLQP
jgi:hypothetical protein